MNDQNKETTIQDEQQLTLAYITEFIVFYKHFYHDDKN